MPETYFLPILDSCVMNYRLPLVAWSGLFEITLEYLVNGTQKSRPIAIKITIP